MIVHVSVKMLWIGEFTINRYKFVDWTQIILEIKTIGFLQIEHLTLAYSLALL